MFDSILYLSDNMSNSPKELLSYIEYFHYTNSSEYEDAAFLVRNHEELDMWIELWDGDPDSVDETNRKLRTWKLEKYLMEQGDFVDLVHLDTKEALETMFVHEVSKRTLIELDNALGDGLRYEDLYRRHFENPVVRVEYLLY